MYGVDLCDREKTKAEGRKEFHHGDALLFVLSGKRYQIIYVYIYIHIYTVEIEHAYPKMMLWNR